MTNATAHHSEILVDRIGLRLAARLDSAPLPHDIGERLRVARQMAITQRKIELQRVPQTARSILTTGGGTVALGGAGLHWLHRLGGVFPLVALAIGLIFIQTNGFDERASEIADVDLQLLTDDLPPAAHTDPGFAQYLKFGPPQ